MTTVWQISAGDEGRDDAKLFREHDVMLLGPSAPGPFDRAMYRRVEGLRGSAIRRLEKFTAEVAAGDVVLLRRGTQVAAIGVVHADGYRHEPAFDDVQGRDIGHARRVVWQDALSGELAAAPAFPAGPIAVFSRVFEAAVVAWAEGLRARFAARDLRPLAVGSSSLTAAELGEALGARGLASGSRVAEAIERQGRLQRWYREHGRASGRPNEQEVVAYMIVPLLLALGWSEEQLGVKWHRIDVAGFTAAPNAAANCALVCVTKDPVFTIKNVGDQVRRMIGELGLAACRRVVVVQEGRVYLLGPAAAGELAVLGHVNPERLREEAVGTLLEMAPAAVLAADAVGTDGVAAMLAKTTRRGPVAALDAVAANDAATASEVTTGAAITDSATSQAATVVPEAAAVTAVSTTEAAATVVADGGISIGS